MFSLCEENPVYKMRCLKGISTEWIIIIVITAVSMNHLVDSYASWRLEVDNIDHCLEWLRKREKDFLDYYQQRTKPKLMQLLS